MHDTDLQPWQRIFREGIATQLTTGQLEALQTALDLDDARLIQGGTTTPPPLQANLDRECGGACPLAFCFLADGARTVGEVEEQFAVLCYRVDQHFGYPAAIREFIAFWDDPGREHARQSLLAEVTAILAARSAAYLPPPAA